MSQEVILALQRSGNASKMSLKISALDFNGLDSGSVSILGTLGKRFAASVDLSALFGSRGRCIDKHRIIP